MCKVYTGGLKRFVCKSVTSRGFIDRHCDKGTQQETGKTEPRERRIFDLRLLNILVAAQLETSAILIKEENFFNI